MVESILSPEVNSIHEMGTLLKILLTTIERAKLKQKKEIEIECENRRDGLRGKSLKRDAKIEMRLMGKKVGWKRMRKQQTHSRLAPQGLVNRRRENVEFHP